MSVQEFTTPASVIDQRRRAVQTVWLPRWAQIRSALQLQIEPLSPSMREALAADESEGVAIEVVRAHPLNITMRQGMGLIVVAALLAGLIPFLVNWTLGTRYSAAIPLAQAARGLLRMAGDGAGFFSILADTAQNAAGLPTLLPGWLAAGLTALGAWINWPLRWLTIWLVYGLGVLVATHLFGARTTLQQFYEATSYAAAPLVLLALSPVPCVGTLVALAAVIWSGAIYVAALRAVTELETSQVILSMLAPAAIFVLVSAGALISLLMTVVRVLM